MPELTARVRARRHAMMWAYLVFHMRKQPKESREILSWLALIEWASLGGKPDEVIA